MNNKHKISAVAASNLSCNKNTELIFWQQKHTGFMFWERADVRRADIEAFTLEFYR